MRIGRIIVLATTLLTGRASYAHDLTCDKRVNGSQIFGIQAYPATLDFTMTVSNANTTLPSDVLGVEDRLIADKFGWSPSRRTPYTLAVGESYTEKFSITVHSMEECRQLAQADGVSDDFIDNVLTVSWDVGVKQCRARVSCLPLCPGGTCTGQPGSTGPPGPAGPSGATGATGPRGPLGPEGLTGAAGPRGPIGLTGALGPIGLTGPAGTKGAIGPIGLTGPAGAVGPVGPAGALGPIGLTGPAGTTGAVGPVGPAGATGAVGPVGPAGATGAVGPVGPIGPIGLTGPAGATGAAGAQGAKGDTGAQGPTGAKGDAGATGATGATGAQGTAGGIMAFGYFYALMPPDNSSTVAAASSVEFPQNGATNGISRANLSEFNLPAIGVYDVSWQVSVGEAGQLVLGLNSGSGVQELPDTVVGRATGTSQITGRVLVTTTSANSILSVRNPSGNSPALTVTPLGGGTHPVSASLVIKQIQ